jgi:hypothetical protein
MVEKNDQKRPSVGDIFKNVKKEFSEDDIRQTYKFHKVIGGGHFGTVRLASPK